MTSGGQATLAHRAPRRSLPLPLAGAVVSPMHSPLWDDAPWRPFPPLDRSLEADLCVVGLGGTGLTAAREALERGLRVVAIDAGMVAGGAAGRNGGFLLAGLAEFYHNARPMLGADRARRLYQCTLAEIARIAGETPRAVRQVGSIRLAMSPDEIGDCEEHLARLRDDHLPAERYQGPEGQGLLLPTDAAFQPLRRCRLLADRLNTNGAQLYEQTRALAVESGIVETAAGTIRAGVILLASDGALAHLAPSLASRIRPVRLQMLGTAPAPEVAIARPIYARYGMEYWQQLPDSRVVLGGFRDLGGNTEWTDDPVPTEPIQKALDDFLHQTIGVRAPVTHRWAATVSYTREGILPILEEVQPGVWAMGAYNGTGNLVGPLCARAALELAVNGDSELGELLGAKRITGQAE